MRLISSETVVRNILSLLGDDSDRKYVRVLRILKTCLTQLQLTVIPVKIKTEKFVISDNLTIDLPGTVSRVLKVGVHNGGVRLLILSEMDVVREDLTPGCTCGASTTPTTLDNLDITDYCCACTFHNCGLGERYGRWHNPDYGFYKYDQDNNRLVFASGWLNAGQVVYVEYQADASEDSLDLIPIDAEMMLQSRVLENYFRPMNPGLAAQYHQNFEIEIREYKRKHLEKSHDEIIRAVSRGYKSSPRV